MFFVVVSTGLMAPDCTIRPTRHHHPCVAYCIASPYLLIYVRHTLSSRNAILRTLIPINSSVWQSVPYVHAIVSRVRPQIYHGLFLLTGFAGVAGSTGFVGSGGSLASPAPAASPAFGHGWRPAVLDRFHPAGPQRARDLARALRVQRAPLEARATGWLEFQPGSVFLHGQNCHVSNHVFPCSSQILVRFVWPRLCTHIRCVCCYRDCHRSRSTPSPTSLPRSSASRPWPPTSSGPTGPGPP